MKKKTILLTTLAGTMIVAGMTATGVKAAVGEATKAIVNEDKNLAIIEYSSEKDQLTRAELEKLVNARYTNAGVSATVAKIGDTVVSEETGAETVGTGTTVELNNNKKLTVVVYGDVTGEGQITSRDAKRVLDEELKTEAEKTAGDVTTGLASRDAKRILDYSAYGKEIGGEFVDKGVDEVIYGNIYTVHFVEDKFDHKFDGKTDKNGIIDEASAPTYTDPNGVYRLLGWTETEGSKELFDFSKKITKDTNLYSVWTVDANAIVKIHYDGVKEGDAEKVVKVEDYKAGDTIKFEEDARFASNLVEFTSKISNNGSIKYTQSGWYVEQDQVVNNKLVGSLTIPEADLEAVKAAEEEEEEYVVEVNIHPSWKIDVTSYDDLSSSGVTVKQIEDELKTLQTSNKGYCADLEFKAAVDIDNTVTFDDGLTFTFDDVVTVEENAYLPAPVIDEEDGTVTEERVKCGPDAVVTKVVDNTNASKDTEKLGLNASLNNPLYDVVQLKDDIATFTTNVKVEEDSEALLDLNGKTLGKNNSAYEFENDGKLKIINSSAEVTGIVYVPNGLDNKGTLSVGEKENTNNIQIANYTSSTAAVLINEEDATLTIESGEVNTRSKNSGVAAVKNDGELVVNGGNIKASNEDVKIPALLNEGTATINNGKFERSANKSDANNNGYAVVVNHGDLNIKDGEFKANDTATAALVVNGYENYADAIDKEKATLTVSGGTYTKGLYAIESGYAGVTSVTGGKYTAEPATTEYAKTIETNKTRSIFKSMGIGEMTIDFSKAVKDAEGVEGGSYIDLGTDSKTMLVTVGDEKLKLNEAIVNDMVTNSVKLYSFDHSLVKAGEKVYSGEDSIADLIAVEESNDSAVSNEKRSPSEIKLYVSGTDAADAGARLISSMKYIAKEMKGADKANNKVRIVLCSDVEITSELEAEGLQSGYTETKENTTLNLNGHTLKINKLAIFHNNVTVVDEKEEGAGEGSGRIVLKSQKSENQDVELFKDGKLLDSKQLKDIADAEIGTAAE